MPIPLGVMYKAGRLKGRAEDDLIPHKETNMLTKTIEWGSKFFLKEEEIS